MEKGGGGGNDQHPPPPPIPPPDRPAPKSQFFLIFLIFVKKLPLPLSKSNFTE
jgi:hypothetical protein